MKYWTLLLIISGFLWAEETIGIERAGNEAGKGRIQERMKMKKGMRREKGFRREGILRKKMEGEVRQWIKGLPEDQAAQAQKIVQYLHTSHEVSKMYLKEGAHQQALEVMKKRSRLKLPDFFSGAPSLLKASKAHSQMEIGSIYAKQGQWEKAVVHYESAMEMSKDLDIPQIMRTRARMELLKVYKKAGMDGKAASILKSTLEEAESGLQFE